MLRDPVLLLHDIPEFALPSLPLGPLRRAEDECGIHHPKVWDVGSVIGSVIVGLVDRLVVVHRGIMQCLLLHT